MLSFLFHLTNTYPGVFFFRFFTSSYSHSLVNKKLPSGRLVFIAGDEPAARKRFTKCDKNKNKSGDREVENTHTHTGIYNSIFVSVLLDRKRKKTGLVTGRHLCVVCVCVLASWQFVAERD